MVLDAWCRPVVASASGFDLAGARAAPWFGGLVQASCCMRIGLGLSAAPVSYSIVSFALWGSSRLLHIAAFWQATLCFRRSPP